MKFLSLVFFALVSMMLVHPTYADNFYSAEYRLGVYKDLTIDFDAPTHIIIVGSAVKEDSNQFFQSGVARAERYKELNPAIQVVLISSPDVVDTEDAEVFAAFHIPVV